MKLGIVLFALWNLVQSENSSCPAYGNNYVGSWFQANFGIISWEECGAFCHRHENWQPGYNCHFWSYNVCDKTCYAYEKIIGTRVDNDFVSGESSCYSSVVPSCW